MPRFDPAAPMTSRRLAGTGYGYSGTRLDALGATEYTLVAIAADQSGSVHSFRADIERCLGEIVRACQAAPRAEQLMLRLTAFDDAVHEIHGFQPIPTLRADDTAGCLVAGGSTALFDAAHNAVASVVSYGDALASGDLCVNGLVIVLTDGEDNRSALTADDVRGAIDAARASERLDSVRTILVCVGATGATSAALARFSAEAGFDETIALDRADAASLQRLAQLASRSISAQSTALGSGRAAASLRF
jgi:uncharacterized protein YegL